MNKDSLRGQYAGFVSRFVAFFIDLAVIATVTLIVSWLITQFLSLIGISLNVPCGGSSGLTSWFTDLRTFWCILAKLSIPFSAFLILIGYPLILWTLTGQSIGKYALGLRIVRMDGRPLTFMNSVRRLFGYYICILLLGIGFFWILISNQRQGWHDKIGGTYVIYVWDARPSERLSGRIGGIADRASARRSPSGSPPSLPGGE